jgi:hypothetical protein
MSTPGPWRHAGVRPRTAAAVLEVRHIQVKVGRVRELSLELGVKVGQGQLASFQSLEGPLLPVMHAAPGTPDEVSQGGGAPPHSCNQRT